MPPRPWKVRLPLYLVCGHLAISLVLFPMGLWRPPRILYSLYNLAETPVFLLFKPFARPLERAARLLPHTGRNILDILFLALPAAVASSLVWAVIGWAIGCLLDQRQPSADEAG